MTAIDPSNNMPYETTCFSADKFAELIVQECATVAEESDDTWTGAGPHAAQAIKEHFGVKE